MSYTKYSHDDKVLIQHYREKWNYGARKIIAEFPDKGWTESGVKRILKKIDEEGSIERKEGSGRPRTARTEENIDEVEQRILSQDDPGSHETPAEIAATMDISKSSVRRIAKKDLELVPLKRVKGQKLNETDEDKRVARGTKLLRSLTRDRVDVTFFSDEKIFKVTGLLNSQNDRFYAPVDELKKDADPERSITTIKRFQSRSWSQQRFQS